MREKMKEKMRERSPRRAEMTCPPHTRVFLQVKVAVDGGFMH